VLESSAIRSTEAPSPVGARDSPVASTQRTSVAGGRLPQDRVTISQEAQDRRGGQKLTAEQQQQLLKLKQRDAHVRQHEAAHQAAGGALTGAASFTYQGGPDGKQYAIGGEVPIRLATGRTPDETIANARQARAAALAPSDPSGADLSVAAAASQMEMAAEQRKAKLASQAYQKTTRTTGEADEPGRAGATAGESGAEEQPTTSRQIAA